MIRKTLLYAGSAVAILVVLVLIAAAFQPDTFSVERSAELSAPPATLFEQVNNHRNFVQWNPFNELDPNVKNIFSGPDSGVGAVCAWKGDANIGEGSSTIIESKANELVRMRMDWVKPMEGTSIADFIFEPQGDKTKVTWKLYGAQKFPAKIISLFLSSEKMCGPMFEKGLAHLEQAAKQSQP